MAINMPSDLLVIRLILKPGGHPTNPCASTNKWEYPERKVPHDRGGVVPVNDPYNPVGGLVYGNRAVIAEAAK